MSLQRFLIGRLQALEQLLRLPTEVPVEAPVTPATASQRKETDHQDVSERRLREIQNAAQFNGLT